jgi:hypothetical protein
MIKGKILNSQEAFELSEYFNELSVLLKNFRLMNTKIIPKENQEEIEKYEWTLLTESAKISTEAVGMVLDEEKISFEKIVQTVSAAKNALKGLAEFRKVLIISTSAVALAIALASKDFGAIGKTANGLYNAIK